MKPIYVYNSWIMNKFQSDNLAMVIYPFILIRDDKLSERVIRHELRHFEQVKEMGWIKFYVSYLWIYYKLTKKYGDKNKAYWEHPYEKDARSYE